MATIHKLTKDGTTIFPATITDAVVHPQTGKTLTSMMKDYNVSELFPTEGVDGGNKYNLALAIQVLGTHLTSAQKTGGIKLTFISSVSPYPEEEYYLGKSTWSGEVEDWDQRFEVGDVVADPSGSWEPSTAEAYIDQQVATVTGNLATETLARQTADQSLQNQINAEATTRANVDNTKADKATTLAGYGITNAYTKTEVNDLVDTPHQNYVTVQTYSDLPATGSADTIYRVSSYDGSVPEVNVTKYSEYAWNGSQYIFLCVKSQIDEVFDITVYHSNTTYSDFSAALGTDGANIPPTLRRGGMSVKYVQSSDNKYVQYRLMSDSFSTTVSDWQIVGDYSSILNISMLSKKYSYNNISEAINDVPADLRALGTIISFRNLNYDWLIYQFIGFNATSSDWTNLNNWKRVDLQCGINWKNGTITNTGVVDLTNNRIVSSAIMNGNYKLTCAEGCEIFVVAYYNADGTLRERATSYPYKSTYLTKKFDNTTYFRVVIRKPNNDDISVNDIEFKLEDMNVSEEELTSTKNEVNTINLFDIFTLKGKFVHRSNGNIYDNANYSCTTLLPLTKTTKVRVKGQWTASVTPIAFYDIYGKFIGNGGGNAYISSRIYEVAVSDIPANAYYVRFTRNEIDDAGYVDYSGIYLSSISIEAHSSSQETKNEYKKQFNLFSYTDIEPDEIIAGKFFGSTGSQESATGFSIYKKNISAGVIYAFSGLFGLNTDIPFIGFFKSDDTCISTKYFNPDLTKPYPLQNQILDIPVGTSYILMNVYDVNIKLFTLKTATYLGDADLQRINGSVNKSMKIVKQGDSFYVRNSISDSKDLIVTFGITGGNITTKKSYIGNSDESDLEIMRNHAQIFNDSQAAIGHQNAYYLYAQHGYCCPKVTQASAIITGTDVNTEWVDNNRNHYYIGKVDSNEIYLLPVVSGAEGSETRGWKDPSSPSPTTLTSVADSNRSVSVFNCERYDLPIQTSVKRKLLADGVEINEGTTYCNEFKILEELIGWNPFDVTTWFPEPIYNTEMVRIRRTYIIIGSTMSVNVSLNFKRKFLIDNYYFDIPQSMLYTPGYDCYAIIPKALRAAKSSSVTASTEYKENINVPFLANSMQDATLYIHRNNNELIDKDKFTDRIISLAKKQGTGGKYEFGFASGFSLINGETVNAKRLNNVEEGSGAVNIVQTFDPSLSNKCYFRLLKPQGFAGEPNYGRIPKDWMGEFTCYYSWFPVSEEYNDVQCFSYKSGKEYIVYIHANSSHTNAFIKLPSYLEGLTVKDVIEKTEGATLKSDMVIDGLYADFTNNPNHIVVKIG